MIRRGVHVNSRTLIVDILRRAIDADECYGDEGDFKWSGRDLELLLIGATRREDLPIDADDDADADAAVEELGKADRVQLPPITDRVRGVVQRLQEILRGDEAKFVRDHYLYRASVGKGISQLMAKLHQLEELYRTGAAAPQWAGFRWVPQRRRQWRVSISTSDLRGSPLFAALRAVVHVDDDAKITWTDVLKACARVDGYDYMELLADNAVCQAKRKAFERFHTIVEGLMDPNTQIISDGVSLQLRIQKDRSVAAAERLGWKGAPLEVRGVARLCRALDQQLGGAGGGLMAALMAEVKWRRVAVKRANSGVERVYDWAAIWDAIEEAARRQGVDVRATFAKILAGGGDAGGGAAAGDSAHSPDMLRKSHLFAQLPAAIAARVVSPDLLASTTTFCFDFGLCKWIGGGIMLPTDQGVDAERVFQPYTVRGGQYHHDVGVNRARSRRAKGDVTPTLEAKLRRMLECGKQRLFHNVLRDMRRIADAAHPGRDFIVIVGDGGIGTGRGHRRPATKEFLKFLQEFVLVIQLDEYNTSKCCPRCWTESVFYWDAHKPKSACHRREWRTKWCTSAHCTAGHGHGFAYDRDTGAGVNFFNVFYSMVRGWGRPGPFARNNGALKMSPSVVQDPPGSGHSH